MARTQQQINAAILANRQKNAPMIAERAARAKETGQDLRTVGRQMRDEAHQASLKRLYGSDLDTTNPAAVNAARAAKQAAAAQSRMDARQIRDADFAAKQAIGEKQAERENAAQRVIQLKEGADRVAVETAKEDKIRQTGLEQIARQAARQAASTPAPMAAPNVGPQQVAVQSPFRPQENTSTPPRPQENTSTPPMPTPQVAPTRQPDDTGFVERTTPMKRGGRVKKMASGGMTSKVSNASKRGDGIAQRGKTRGRYI